VGKLVYSAITSLDGYVADENGNFDWAAPDDEVHGFVNDLERPIGTYLYGRRMYETMAVWDDPATIAGHGATMEDYAQIWQAAEKVVYSTTLDGVWTARTRLERAFDTDAVRAIKDAANSDISVGGPHLAAAALRAGLVDEIHSFLGPVLVGGGTRALPDGVRAGLELLSERRFAGGTVYVSYRVREGGSRT